MRKKAAMSGRRLAGRMETMYEEYETGNEDKCYCNLYIDYWAYDTLDKYEWKCFHVNGTTDFGEYE